jgi:hypothetical protein
MPYCQTLTTYLMRPSLCASLVAIKYGMVAYAVNPNSNFSSPCSSISCTSHSSSPLVDKLLLLLLLLAEVFLDAF